ncbi:hypothetical protein EVG20_g9251 [Dentipellis fragilis]|uniref:Uncharacterized protein n=1 Tax=Dentipellis fragilis TaxID=205917 RepID=A0A4Y9Y224_9AGAM|nr:hypothetical protein EVG20_g9251 [Dentipellis fragilis]
MTSTSQIDTDSLASFKDAVQQRRTINYDNVVLPSRAQLEQELHEAKLARDQGRISDMQYCKILCTCSHMGDARLNRAVQGSRDAVRGERGRELMKRNFDLTDSEVDESNKQALRLIAMKMENERRSERGMFQRTVTRGL